MSTLSLGLGAREEVGELVFTWDDYKKSTHLTDVRLSLPTMFWVKTKKKKKRKQRTSSPPLWKMIHLSCFSKFTPTSKCQHPEGKCRDKYLSCCLFGTRCGISKDKAHGSKKFLVSKNHYEDTMEIVLWSGETLASLSGRPAPRWMKTHLSFSEQAVRQPSACSGNQV